MAQKPLLPASPEQIELVWTNPTPSASFDGQTVNVDLSGYDAVFIAFTALGSSYQNTQLAFCKIGDSAILMGFYVTSNDAQITYRSAQVSSSGVIFSQGGYLMTFGAVPHNGAGYSIPKEIYGLKLI